MSTAKAWRAGLGWHLSSPKSLGKDSTLCLAAAPASAAPASWGQRPPGLEPAFRSQAGSGRPPSALWYQKCSGSSQVAQQVKDLALSLLWRRFHPWPRNFHMLLACAMSMSKKQTNKQKSAQRPLQLSSTKLCGYTCSAPWHSGSCCFRTEVVPTRLLNPLALLCQQPDPVTSDGLSVERAQHSDSRDLAFHSTCTTSGQSCRTPRPQASSELESRGPKQL